MIKPKSILVILLGALLTACPNPTPTAPPTPVGLTATATSSAGIQVSWIASQGAKSYTLERRTDATAFVGVGGSITTTTFADIDLQPTTKYTYRVRAVGDGGASQPSPEAFATTPTDLLNLQPTATSSTTVNLTWTTVPGASGYSLERRTATGTYTTISSPSGTSYTDTGLTPNRLYTYRVSALQTSPGVADEANITTPPSNPTNLSSSFPGTGVTLTWTAPTEPGTYVYTLERKQGAGVYSSLASLGTTTYTDATAAGATTYTYRLKSVSNGNSSSGLEKDVTVPLADPTGFAATGLTTKRVVLNWNAVAGATYSLDRSLNSGSFTPLASGLTSTTYLDTSLTAGTTYNYRLRSVVGSITSGGVTLPTALTTPTASTPIKVLFIGNSLTFVNSVPQMLQTLAADAGEAHAVQFEMVVKSGASLSYHWTNTTDPVPDARSKIQSGPTGGGNWDYVVLQEMSINPVCDVNSFSTNVANFVTEVKTYNPNAKVILHQNWVITDTPTFQSCGAYFSSPLSQIVGSTNARADAQNPISKIVPVGQAWANSGANLLQSDGVHATPEGSYLAAATYYALLYNKSPVGLTNLVKANQPGVIDPNPNLLSESYNTVSTTEAAQFQTIAWNTVQALDAKYRLP